MLLTIDHHSGVPIYRQAMDQIRQQILAGQMLPEEKLDSVRELSTRLKVNPMTISKAYSLLEAEGLLERRRGIGLFVAKVNKRHQSVGTAQLLDPILKKAAATAIQLGLSPDEVTEKFSAMLEKYSAKKETQS